MQSNISMLDRYVRLTSGLVLLGCAMGMKRRSALAKSALIGFGAMKVAEGATGWCPLVHLAETLSGLQNKPSPASGQSATNQTGATNQQSAMNRSNSDYTQDKSSATPASNVARNDKKRDLTQSNGQEEDDGYAESVSGRAHRYTAHRQPAIHDDEYHSYQ